MHNLELNQHSSQANTQCLSTWIRVDDGRHACDIGFRNVAVCERTGGYLPRSHGNDLQRRLTLLPQVPDGGVLPGDGLGEPGDRPEAEQPYSAVDIGELLQHVLRDAGGDLGGAVAQELPVLIDLE